MRTFYPTVFRGDILELRVDAIVNPANEGLRNGGGLAGKIASDGGPVFRQACKDIINTQGSVPTGTAVASVGGNLYAKWVVHTPGPIFSKHPEPAKALASSHRQCIRVAVEIGAKSLVFPAISCGIFGYPVEQAAPIAIGATIDAMNEYGLKDVRFCLWDQKQFGCFTAALEKAQRV